MECRFVRQRTRDIEFCGKTLQNAVFFYENSRFPRGFFAFTDLVLTHVRRPVPGFEERKKGKPVTIRGKLIGTNTGTSAPLTAPFFGAVLGEAPVGETGAWQFCQACQRLCN
jgi:hypothetical protein